MFKLLDRKLLTISRRFKGACKFKLSHLRVYNKFVKMEMSKNLDYNIYKRILHDGSILTFDSSSMSQRIRVLTLYKCDNLERADLGNLPMLRSLPIEKCPNFKEILGWENLSELGWLELGMSHSYREHLRVHCLPSLKEFLLDFVCTDYSSEWNSLKGFNLDFSQCVRLRKVKIVGDSHQAKSVDLSTLKSLESLSLYSKSLRALSALVNYIHSLKSGSAAVRPWKDYHIWVT